MDRQRLYDDFQQIVDKFVERYDGGQLPEIAEVAQVAMIMTALALRPMGIGVPLPAMAMQGAAPNYADMARVKFQEAEGQWALYRQSGDDVFRQIARQDLAHGSAYIAKMGNDPAAGDLKARLQNLERVIR